MPAPVLSRSPSGRRFELKICSELNMNISPVNDALNSSTIILFEIMIHLLRLSDYENKNYILRII